MACFCINQMHIFYFKLLCQKSGRYFDRTYENFSILSN